MRTYLVAVVSEIDESALFIRVVRLASGKYSYDGISPDPIECIGVARNNAFEGVMFEDGDLELLLGFALSCH